MITLDPFGLAERHGRTAVERPASTRAQPLCIEPTSAWASRPEPLPRDWVWEGLVPAGRVTSFLGDGGVGKTNVAVQLAVHVAVSRALYGVPVSGGPVVGIFCEDEQEEIERRTRAVCAAEEIELSELNGFFPLSRDGEDNILCGFKRERMTLTRLYSQLEATIADIKPRLVILDTAADLFAGDFMSTPHVRQFVKVALGGLCVRHGCAVLLLAHPSASGMRNGSGGGYSVSWSNSVRSRFYLRRPQSDDKDAAKDRRVLEAKKTNYAPDGWSIPLVYRDGCFVLDDDPIQEGSRPTRAARSSTPLAKAVVEQLRGRAPNGEIVTFKEIFEPLQAIGMIRAGEYEIVRKPLQRVLRSLVSAGQLIESKTPRGYGLAQRPTAGAA